MAIKLSEIPQRDCFDIITRAIKNCAVCHFRDQLAFTTPQLCALLKIKPIELDEVVSSYPAEVLAGEVFTAVGEELSELLAALLIAKTIGSARLWTPRAVLRIAALMTNPVAKAIHVSVAAWVASMEAEKWLLAPTIPPELGTSNLELGTSNLELGTSNLELGTSNLELGTLPELGTSRQRDCAASNVKTTKHYTTGHSQ